MAAARARTDVAPAAPRSDVYTVLLLISLVAMLAGTLLLFLDYQRYPTTKPPQPPARAAAPAANAPGPGAGGGATAAPGQPAGPGGAGAPATAPPAGQGGAPAPQGGAPK